ncbi:MAG: hypothetical protein EPN70_10270 [Paraburkholderia sp.]|uniref:hypothetical protein n=1 Tax=Paraburkholderia sp. TaxID=1926495 RepID=UPI0011FE61B8|nr:hypothetical protein [Paraburkholderia sp.]TAM04937.1 MAG: hypothetical protein EPN70_10270 [Paraburkholderia sp.]TAM29559.1 MAG: hypothetical protein EPN59_11445 [Paraburkholderia sp.]
MRNLSEIHTILKILFLSATLSITSFNITFAAVKNDFSTAESAEKSIFANAPSIDFEWGASKMGSLYVKHGAMMIRAREEMSGREVKFQLDTGTPRSPLYENAVIEQLGAKYTKADAVEFCLAFSDSYKRYMPFYYMRSLGMRADKKNPLPALGTLGLDFFTSQPVAIDFPAKKIYFLPEKTVDEIRSNPNHSCLTYQSEYKNIRNKIFIPFKIGAAIQYAMFDTGSSAMELYLPLSEWKKFQITNHRGQNYETLIVNAWEKPITLWRQQASPPIEIGSAKFNVSQIYTSPDSKFPAIIGNALLLNKIVVIDTARHLFGILQ